MICPQCKTPNRESAKFCDECGFRLAEVTLPSITLPEVEESHEDSRVAALADLPQTIEEPVAEEAADSWFDEAPSEQPSEEEGVQEDAPVEEPVEPEETPGVEAQSNADLSGFVFADSSADASNTKVTDAGTFNAFETASIPMSSMWGAGNTAAMPKIEGVPSAEAVTVHAPASKKEERERNRAMKKKEREARKQLKEAQNANKGSSRKYVLFGVLGVILAAAIIGGLTYYCEFWGGKTVPNTQGMTVADATRTLQSEGFTVTVSNVKSDDFEGTVLLSDPSSGARVPQGTEIVIHVAESRLVPEIVGINVDRARVLLDAEGFTTGLQFNYVKTNEHEEGTVLSVSPEPGTKAKSTSAIVVEVATPYRIPDVSGMSSGDAMQTLYDAGFTNIYLSEIEMSDIPEGTVYSTNPLKDEICDPESYITIYVAVQRATKLVSLATDYLMSQGSVQNGIYTYVIDGVQSVTYSGNGVVSFTVTSSAVILPIFGQTSIPTQTVVGTITFDENNQIVSVG